MTDKEKKLRDIIGLNIENEGNINYSIKAGAGGGKTTMLSNRICRQIIKGTPIEEFVVITYTEVAATELRNKITENLQEIVDKKAGLPVYLDNAKKALETIELMQISTIHSFLLRILRENSFEAGIVLDVQMLEEDENESRKKAFFDEWYKNHFEEINGYSKYWNIATKSGNSYDYTEQVLENMFMEMADVREQVVCDMSKCDPYIKANAKDYVSEWFPYLKKLKDAIMANDDKPNGKGKRSCNKKAQIILEKTAFVEGGSGDDIANARELSKAIEQALVIKKNNGKKIYNRCDDLFPDIITAVDDIDYKVRKCELEWEWNFEKYYEMAEDSKKTLDTVEYVLKMSNEYKKYIDSVTTVLSNNDILYRADQLLTENGEILDKIRKQYSKIYVDEFQDTTGIQARIVKLISQKPGTKYENDEMQEDKLIVVGDPKQSIYRFTGAEKAVYDDVDAMMNRLPDTIAESVTLDTNFRSNKAVVKWVNDSYNKLIPGYTAMDTDWEIKAEESLYGVYRCDDPVKMENETSDEYRVVELVKRLVDNDKVLIEERKKNDERDTVASLRRIKYSDIMIILKTTLSMTEYIKAFSENAIPVNVQGKFMINNDEVINNFILLVEYFAAHKNKKHRVAAAQILKGVDATAISKEALKEAEEELRGLRKIFRENKMNSAAIVRYLLSREELYVPKNKTFSKERIREYRMRLNQMVESCLLNCDGDMYELVASFNRYISQKVNRENSLESDEDAVQLMNVHKVKGLTGHIVIVADRTVNEKCRYDSFRKMGEFYPDAVYAAKMGKYTKRIIVPSFAWNKDIMKQVYRDEMDESVRLQYVAATRAAYALVLMPPANQNVWFTAPEYGYDQLPDIKAWLDERDKADAIDLSEIEREEKHHTTLRLNDLADNLKNTDFDELNKAQIISITPSDLEKSGSTGYIPDDKGKYVKEDRPSAAIFGTVMHRVYQIIFERFKQISGSTEQERELLIDRIINQSIMESYDDLREVDDPNRFFSYLKKKMAEYYDKVIVPIVESAEEVYTEYSFSFIVSRAERNSFIDKFSEYYKGEKDELVNCEKIWVNGKTDLIVKEKDGRVMVYDYKSDAHNGKPMDDFIQSMNEKYEGQLALYSYAIAKAFGVSNVETKLIHLYL